MPLTVRLAWINWDNLGVGPSRRGILSNLQLTSAAPLPMGAAGDPAAAMMGMPMQGLVLSSVIVAEFFIPEATLIIQNFDVLNLHK